MKLKSLLLAASAAFTVGAGAAQAAGTGIVEARSTLNRGTTTPQVAYPPICRHDPLFPKYCKRW